MAAKTYGLLFVKQGSGELIVASTVNFDRVLVLNKETLSGKTLQDEVDWQEGYAYNADAQLVPIPVECPACGESAELWWLWGAWYSQHFVVCDCECQQAIQLHGCDG